MSLKRPSLFMVTDADAVMAEAIRVAETYERPSEFLKILAKEIENEVKRRCEAKGTA